MKAFRAILCVSVIIFGKAHAHTCEELTAAARRSVEQFDGRSVSITTLVAPPVRNGFVALKDLTADPTNEVILGHTGGHFYLLVDGIRADASPMCGLSIREGIQTVGEGYFFRFRNLPAETIAKLKKSIDDNKGRRSISCAHGVCRVLREGGISIKDRKRLTEIFPTAAFEQILRKGFIDENGKNVEFEIVNVNRDSVPEFLKLSHRSDFDQVGEMAMIYGFFLPVLVGASGGVIYNIFFLGS